ncbi:MAG: DUF1905 domain-containing protein [Chitinophagales bacterium]|nr:DUF1905 domain-containing protein [Chitinophagales bacterium]
MGKVCRFKAKIETTEGGGAFVYFPYDVQKEFGIKGRVPVKATFDGVAYTGSMVKYGDPRHMLLVLKPIRAQIGKTGGDEVEVTVQHDVDERTIVMPKDFTDALKAEKLLTSFEQMSFTHRKEYITWIESAKKQATRESRIVKALEMLKEKVK